MWWGDHPMRLVLRLLGTWLVAVALILGVVDGTKSLAANSLIFTSFAEAWTWLNAESLAVTQTFLESRLFGPVLETISDAVFSAPAWLVIAIPGLLIAWMGRSRRVRLFVRHDQI
jgi:hypothetical protein